MPTHYITELPTTRYQRVQNWLARSDLGALDDAPWGFMIWTLAAALTVGLQIWFWTEPWWWFLYPLTMVPFAMVLALQVILSRGRSKAFVLEYDRYSFEGSRESYAKQVWLGHQAFLAMEPVLQSESREVYRAMVRCLRRYQVAEERYAMEQAARRGLLLQDIKKEGRLTRASQIPLDDDSDLNYGQNIVEAMRQIRRELS